MSTNLNNRVNRLSEIIAKMDQDGHLNQTFTYTDILTIRELLISQRNALAKRARFYVEAQRRRDALRVANGPDGEGRDRAMARLGLIPRELQEDR